MSIGRTALRATVGGYFAAHGAQKLFGWFDGDGIDATAAMFESVGIRPSKANAILAGATEAGGGVALALGAATSLAATGLTGVMVTAIRKVHLRSGPFVQKHGYEYNLVLIGVLLTLAESGPGWPAIDDADGGGRARALAVLAAGVAGSLIAEAAGRRLAGPVESERPVPSAV